MFTVILVVVALADYVITVFCILTVVDKPIVKTEEIPEEIPEEIMNNVVIGHINDDKEFNSHIEEQNYRIALLSSNIEEILSNIDSIMEKKQLNQGVLVK